jgi:hypothetical protein
MNNMPANAPGTDPALTGIVYRIKSTSAVQAISVNALSYVEITSNDRELIIPTITYPNTRICYRYLIQFDLHFTTSTDWHNKQISLSDSTTVIKTIPVNQWDFETALATYNPTFALSGVKFFADNFRCTKTTLDLKFESDLAAPGTWGVRNLNIYWFQCPLDCIDCLTSDHLPPVRRRQVLLSSNQPLQRSLHNARHRPGRPGRSRTPSLFKPHSVFLYFTKTMNFNLGDQFQYFFPTFVLGPSCTPAPNYHLSTGRCDHRCSSATT